MQIDYKICCVTDEAQVSWWQCGGRMRVESGGRDGIMHGFGGGPGRVGLPLMLLLLPFPTLFNLSDFASLQA
jgi:hypothetical protein